MTEKLREVDRKLQAMDKKARQDGEDFGVEADPSFTRRILEEPLPRNFKIPQFELYDGLTDPVDHLASFRLLMLLHGVSDAIKCRAFPATLKKASRTWYSALEPGSIDSFADLSKKFVGHFISSQSHKKTTTSLLAVKQKKDESFLDYIHRFNSVALEIKNLDQADAVVALMGGLQIHHSSYSLAKRPPRDLQELLSRADKYINADELLSKRRRDEGPDQNRGRGGDRNESSK